MGRLGLQGGALETASVVISLRNGDTIVVGRGAHPEMDGTSCTTCRTRLDVAGRDVFRRQTKVKECQQKGQSQLMRRIYGPIRRPGHAIFVRLACHRIDDPHALVSILHVDSYGITCLRRGERGRGSLQGGSSRCGFGRRP